jgi:DNA-nicking Smr family endonuclease
MSADDESEMDRLIPGVKRLRDDRINVYRHRERKKPAPRSRPREAVGPDDFTAESGLAQNSHFNSGLQLKLQRRIRQGVIRPEARIDLHGYRQNEALAALQEFLAEALSNQYRMILIIHGQGYRSQSDAVLKPLVQRWLSSHPQVLAWCPAQARDGAAGASYVYLRTG